MSSSEDRSLKERFPTKGIAPFVFPAPLLNILTSVVSLALLIALAELGTAIYLKISGHVLPVTVEEAVDDKNSLYQFDSGLGWVLRPHYSQDGIEVNSLGFRSSREFDFGRTDQKNIMLLGDSMIFGKDVPQPQIFSELLNAEATDFTFINAGVNGYSTWQEYLTLKRFVDRIQPRMVILFYTQANDLDWNMRRDSFHPGVTLQEDQLISGGVSRNNQITFYKRLLSYRLLDHMFLHGSDLHYFIHRLDFLLRGKDSQGWRVARKILSEFSRLGDEKGFSIIVIDIPNIRQLRNVWPSQRHRQLLREACLDENFTYHDLADYYPKDFEKLLLPDHHHWNPDGHRFVAEHVKEIVEA